jgi:hypothetical protein
VINGCADQQIVDELCEIEPRPAVALPRRRVTDGRRRYEEQDLDLLLHTASHLDAGTLPQVWLIAEGPPDAAKPVNTGCPTWTLTPH